MEIQLPCVLFLWYRNDFVLFVRLLFPSFKLTLLYTGTRYKILQSHFCTSSKFLLGVRNECWRVSGSLNKGEEMLFSICFLFLLRWWQPLPSILAVQLLLDSRIPPTPTFPELSLLFSSKTTSTNWLAVPSQKSDF